MRRRGSAGGSNRRSSSKRRSENIRFDEFGFALIGKKEQKLHQRCHDYSYPQMSPSRVKELCELLSYWNGASFICRSQIERFIRMGIPPSLRGRVWKCLLNVDNMRDTSDFNYQRCLSEVRGPLVDLGVSEYGILSAITTLSDRQNDLGSTNQQSSSCTDPAYSRDDVTLFHQIALDLRRSFPTHRSLMGDTPEAIEGQAKLFRVLIAYAKYNPDVGYSQGMSYIAAVLLMQLGEEESFWALVALLDKPKYLAQLFDQKLTKVQHQVFDQFLRHRKPELSQHMESVGVSSVHFVMPWFLTLFTSLPCWDSVLAIWDLIILHGLAAVFRAGLTIVQLLESRMMTLTDEGSVLPLLLRVPVDVARYSVLVPALWDTEVQDWEIKCMNSLVLDETNDGVHTEQLAEQQKVVLSSQAREEMDTEQDVSTPVEEDKKSEKDTGAKSVLVRVVHLVQQYLLNPMVQRGNVKDAQPQASPRHNSSAPGRFSKSPASASLSQAQIRSRRRSSQHRGLVRQDALEGAGGDHVGAADTAGASGSEGREDERRRPTFRRRGTGPVGKVARRRSSTTGQLGLRTLRLPWKSRKPASLPQTSSSSTPSASPVLPSPSPPPPPPSSSTSDSSSSSLPPAFQDSEAVAAPSTALLHPKQRQQQQQEDTSARAALIKELSSRHQSGVIFRNPRESKLI